MKTIRDKLREANIKITELSYYLGISRPTLYNFIDMYINKNYDYLEKRVLDLFTYIDNTKPLTGPILLNYMINNQLSENVSFATNEDELIVKIKKMQDSKSNNDMLRVRLIKIIVETVDADFVIEDLVRYIEDSSDRTIAEFVKYIKKNKGDI